MNKAMQAALVLAVLITSIVAVSVVSDTTDAKAVWYDDFDKAPEVPKNPTEGDVCRVGDQTYSDFSEAYNAAIESGQELVLLTDFTIISKSVVDELVIDLNQYTLAFDTIAVGMSEDGTTVGKLTIKNGTLYGQTLNNKETGAVDCTIGSISVYSGCTVELSDVSYYTKATALFVSGQGATANVVNGTVIHAIGYCIGTNASGPENHGVIINVSGSSLYADETVNGAQAAILFNVPGNLNITDSTIQGYCQGVIVRGGTAVIQGSEIKNTMVAQSPPFTFDDDENWGSGNYVPNGGLVIGNKSPNSYQYPSDVSLADTKITCDGVQASSSPAIYAYSNVSEGNGIHLVYNENCVFEAVSEDIVLANEESGNIVAGTPVAKIGDKDFASLQAAFDAVPTDGTVTTVTLVDDAVLPYKTGLGVISVQKGAVVLLDLNTHSVTVQRDGSGTSQYAFSIEGEMTVKDDSNVGTISSRGMAVEAGGVFNLESGTIDAVDSTGGAAVYVEGEFNMSGGTLMVSATGSDSPCINNREAGTSIVTGGSFDPSKWTICNMGTLEISDVTLTNDTVNWNAIKVFTGNVTIENCIFDLSLGGGVEVTSESGCPAPEVTISNSEFAQNELSDTQSHNSMCVAVSGGSPVTVNDCTFNTVAFGFYVFNSGGSIEVNGGNYTATGEKALFQIDAKTADPPITSEVVVNGGTFRGALPTVLGENETLTIYGGRFLDQNGQPNTVDTQYVAKGYAIDEETGSVVLADDVPCVAKIGDRQFASLSDAVDAASERTGDVTITIVGEIDLSDSFEDPELSFDLSDSDITSLRIQGSGESASFTSGVNGNNIDGPTYCPAVRFTLPDGAKLTIDGITFQNDLWIDNNSGPVSFTGCKFHGSISAYPQSDRVTFHHNIFDFKGTASKFYTHNAYPMWFKITNRNTGTVFDLVFTENDVRGYRGVHIENRSNATVNIEVRGNTFTLDEDNTDYNNKTIALQLVNQMNGKVVFTGNTVDAYMAVCLFKDVNFTGTIVYANNTLLNGCKAFGSSEWNSDSAEAADDFAASLLPARIGDVYYPSLADALDAVQNGQTITLLDDVTEKVTIDSRIDLTLDLNGHTLHYDGTIPYNQGGDETINIVNGTLTITDSSEWSVTADEEYNVTYNGTGSVTYNGSGRAIKVSGENAHLIVNGGYIHSDGGDGIYVTGNTTPDGAAWNCSVTMNGGYVHSTEYGIGVAGNGAILTMNGGYVEADNNAAIGGNGTSNGSSFRGGTVVTVTGGTVIGNITSSGYISCGIYHPQAGTLTISGGTIVSTNGVGVLMRGGQMEMTGGTIIVQTEGESGWVGDNKNDVSPNGIVLDGAADYYDYANSSVKVSEGSIEATTPVSVTENPDIPSTGKVQVSGGTYTGAVDETFIAEGYVLTGSEGSYSVVKQLTVSFVNGDQTTTQTVVSGGNVTVPSVTDPEGFGHVWSDGSLTYTDSEVAAMEIEEDITFEISYILELPEVTIDSDNSDPVVGDNVVLTASVSNTAAGATYAYVWSDGTTGGSTTVTSSGTYTVIVTVSYGDQNETGTATITLSFGPDFPPFIPGGDDDDVYVPPTVVVDQGSSDDDEAVKIVACAACAVVAAFLAAVMLFHRRD